MHRRQKGMPMTTVFCSHLWLPLGIRRHLIVRLRNPDRRHIIWILRIALMSCKDHAITRTKCTSMFFHIMLFHFSLYSSCLLWAAYHENLTSLYQDDVHQGYKRTKLLSTYYIRYSLRFCVCWQICTDNIQQSIEDRQYAVWNQLFTTSLHEWFYNS